MLYGSQYSLWRAVAQPFCVANVCSAVTLCALVAVSGSCKMYVPLESQPYRRKVCRCHQQRQCRDKAATRALIHTYLHVDAFAECSGNESAAVPVACHSLRLTAVSWARLSRRKWKKNEKLAATIWGAYRKTPTLPRPSYRHRTTTKTATTKNHSRANEMPKKREINQQVY